MRRVRHRDGVKTEFRADITPSTRISLKDKLVVVRRAELDEKLTTLDGVERQSNPSILFIADAAQPVALAGIMGGEATEISSSTTNVFLESAYFNPQSIRKTARTLGMFTEASHRFERGADVETAAFACDRAAVMIRELAGGTILKGVIDVYPGKTPARAATLRRERIAAVLGAAVDDNVVDGVFSRLELKPQTHGGGLVRRGPFIPCRSWRRRRPARGNCAASSLRQIPRHASGISRFRRSPAARIENPMLRDRLSGLGYSGFCRSAQVGKIRNNHARSMR